MTVNPPFRPLLRSPSLYLSSLTFRSHLGCPLLLEVNSARREGRKREGERKREREREERERGGREREREKEGEREKGREFYYWQCIVR